MLLWTWRCIYLFELVFCFVLFFAGVIYLGVELLGNIMLLFIVFETPPYNFPKWRHHFMIPTSIILRVPNFSTPLLLSLILAIVTDVKWYLVAILICISLITNEVKYTFTCLLDKWRFLLKCTLKSSAYLKLWVLFYCIIGVIYIVWALVLMFSPSV